MKQSVSFKINPVIIYLISMKLTAVFNYLSSNVNKIYIFCKRLSEKSKGCFEQYKYFVIYQVRVSVRREHSSFSIIIQNGRKHNMLSSS